MTRTLKSARATRGLSLIELMIAIAIGMVVVAALLALFLNVTRTNNEMAKMNRQIENGRFAIQLLQDDVMHAGFWDSYAPQFDDLTTVTVPLDAPTALPDPCLAYNPANWNGAYLSNLIGIPVQADVGTCGVVGVVANQQANVGVLTDVLVVRRAMNCVAGVGNCESDTAGKLYFQSSQCEKEMWALAQGGASTTITLDVGASSTVDFYKGTLIRIIDGTGAGQSRTITGYTGGTSKTATVDSAWAITPDNSSVYAFGLGYVLGTKTGTADPFIFNKRDCATPANKRKFVSNIYYIRNYATTPGDGTPTLVQSSFDLSGGTLAQQPAQALIEGIEGFRVMYGIDSLSKGGTPENYLAPVAWVNPYNKVTPTNRGDGVPEGAYVNAASVTCNGATNCNAANVVAVRIYVLARSLETTPGYTDTKTYQLGDISMGPFNDGFKRHVYSTTARLVNPASRRDTP
jgi:Tfp pilus assembly protein PilW